MKACQLKKNNNLEQKLQKCPRDTKLKKNIQVYYKLHNLTKFKLQCASTQPKLCKINISKST